MGLKVSNPEVGFDARLGDIILTSSAEPRKHYCHADHHEGHTDGQDIRPLEGHDFSGQTIHLHLSHIKNMSYVEVKLVFRM